jgi:hypothetical protein
MISIFYPFLHLIISLSEWILLGLSIRLCRNSFSVAMIVLPIVLASISYDNLILGSGNIIGVGELLKNLSVLRFLLHYCAVPFFVVIGVELAHRAGAKWANPLARTSSWFIAIGLACIDIFTKFINLNLEPVEFLGVLRYINVNPSGVPIITIIVTFFVILIGIGLWARIKWPWLFIGAIVSLIGNIIPISIVGTIIGGMSEFCIAFSLLLTEKQTQSKKSKINSIQSSY